VWLSIIRSCGLTCYFLAQRFIERQLRSLWLMTATGDTSADPLAWVSANVGLAAA